LDGSKKTAEVRRLNIKFKIVPAEAYTAVVAVFLHLVGASVVRKFREKIRVLLQAVCHDEYVVNALVGRVCEALADFTLQAVEGFPQSAGMGMPASSLKSRKHAAAGLE